MEKEEELSHTIYTFYFCDKQKQILSDKYLYKFKKKFESTYLNPPIKDINEGIDTYNSSYIEKNHFHGGNKILNKKKKNK